MRNLLAQGGVSVALKFRLVLPVLLVLYILFVVASHIVEFTDIFSPHSGIGLTQDEVVAVHNATTPDPRPQVIPKIIHQIFHNWKDPGNSTLPSDWDEQRHTCMAHNNDWDYKFWTESTSRLFISTNYPWFLRTYDSYRYPVQRVDALRYFLLLHFGGIYIDLDNGCLRDLTPLLYYPIFVIDPGHGTLMNNILGGQPGHPFWRLMTDSLIESNWNYFLPYITVMYTAGQWFESALWERYHAQLAKEDIRGGGLYRLMMDSRLGAAPWLFFNQGRGRTWGNWDKELLEWIGDHIVPVLLGSAALAVGALWLMVRMCLRCRWKMSKGYARLVT